MIYSIGRRKTSIARIFLKKGTGNIYIFSKKKKKIVKKLLKEYFINPLLINNIEQVFKIIKTDIKKYDLLIRVNGGGISGQSNAVKLAISRIFCKIDEKNKFSLKEKGFLTRDYRKVERKKFGRKKARKKFQFSKR